VSDAGYGLIVGDEEGAEEEADRLQEDYYKSLKRDMLLAAILALLVMLLGMGFGDMPWNGYLLWLLSTPACVLVRQAFLHRGLEAGPAWKRQHEHASSIVHPDFIFIQLVQPAVPSCMDVQGHRASSVFRVIRYDRGLHPGRKGTGRKGKAQHHRHQSVSLWDYSLRP
jgi:hypothetical protein